MPRIFISYRRDDARWAARMVFDGLRQRFGDDEVFLDPEISPGQDFRQMIQARLEESQALVAIIGPSWLHISDALGRRRLDDPQDLVAHEIGTALERGILVIPVVLDGAPIPQREDLPARLAGLGALNALETTVQRFPHDLERLAATLERAIRSTGGARHPLDQLLGDYASATVERYEERRTQHPKDLQRNLLDFYVESRGAPQPPRGDASQEAGLLRDLVAPTLERGTPCMVLADFGMGKTWFLQVLQYRLAREAAAGGEQARLPLWVNLRGVKVDGGTPAGSSPIDRLRLAAFTSAVGESASGRYRRELLEYFDAGRFVFLFDALDEMPAASRRDRDLVLDDIGRLGHEARRSPVVVTCRRSYFPDAAQERRLIDRGFDVVYLWPWSRDDLSRYLENARAANVLPVEPAKALGWIETTYGLSDVAGRAMLSAMLVDQWDALQTGGPVDLPSLYEGHIEKAVLNWNAPKSWQLERHDLRRIMEEIAFLMFRLDTNALTPDELDEYFGRQFRALGVERLSAVAESIVRDVRVNSLLLREEDSYVFCHASIWEFLVARRLARGLERGEPEVFQVASRAVKYESIVQNFLLPMLARMGRMDLVGQVFSATGPAA